MNIYKFKIYGHEYETKVVRRDEDEVVISVNGQEYKAYLQGKTRKSAAKPIPKIARPAAAPTEGTKVTAKPSADTGAGAVKAPLPGLIMKVVAKEGESVKTGAPVVIMEAMKMQNQIAAPMDGVVSKIHVKEGDSVMEGDMLVTISPA